MNNFWEFEKIPIDSTTGLEQEQCQSYKSELLIIHEEGSIFTKNSTQFPSSPNLNDLSPKLRCPQVPWLTHTN